MAGNRRRRIEFRQMIGCYGLGGRRCGGRLVVAAIGALRAIALLRIGMPRLSGFVAGRFFDRGLARMGQQVFRAMASQCRLHRQDGAGQGKQCASKNFHMRPDYTLSGRSI